MVSVAKDYNIIKALSVDVAVATKKVHVNGCYVAINNFSVVSYVIQDYTVGQPVDIQNASTVAHISNMIIQVERQ